MVGLTHFCVHVWSVEAWTGKIDPTKITSLERRSRQSVEWEDDSNLIVRGCTPYKARYIFFFLLQLSHGLFTLDTSITTDKDESMCVCVKDRMDREKCRIIAWEAGVDHFHWGEWFAPDLNQLKADCLRNSYQCCNSISAFQCINPVLCICIFYSLSALESILMSWSSEYSIYRRIYSNYY